MIVECDAHVWRLGISKQFEVYHSGGSWLKGTNYWFTELRRVDEYYCERCCATRTEVRTSNPGESPDWWSAAIPTESVPSWEVHR